MLLVYNGPHPDVYVIDGENVALEDVQPGVPVEVQNVELADRLLDQATWSKAPAPIAPSSASPSRPGPVSSSKPADPSASTKTGV